MPYRNLTSEQMDAVKFNGNLLLTACPWSGKNKKTLVSKLCFILENKELFCIGKKEDNCSYIYKYSSRYDS